MKIERGSESLPVMESFYSIQGEGYHSGKPAYFIRLAGCDVNVNGVMLKIRGVLVQINIWM